nr:PREDICTED: uncharacterized protein LOC102365165 [Latimeria chalumnae]|eukprot:XP_014348105.1 PREDICTED: uncharacterized protein LOC102365165 [Latimeria chalumnae]
MGQWKNPNYTTLGKEFKIQKYRYQDDDTTPHDHSLPRLTHEIKGPELVHVSEKNLSQIENIHGYVSHSHISPLKVGTDVQFPIGIHQEPYQLSAYDITTQGFYLPAEDQVKASPAPILVNTETLDTIPYINGTEIEYEFEEITLERSDFSSYTIKVMQSDPICILLGTADVYITVRLAKMSYHRYFPLIAEHVSSLDIEKDYMRGQGCDKGSNMSGEFNGVQAQIKEVDPEALYTVCKARSLSTAIVHL